MAQAAAFEGLSDCIEVSSDTNVGTGNYDYSGLPNGGVCVQKVKNNNGQTVYYFGLTQDAADAMNSIDDSSANSVLYDDPNNKDKVTFNPDGDGSVVSGVQDGSVAEGSTEAVNGSQLWEVQQQAIKAKTTVSAGNNIEVTASLNEDGSTNYQVATAKDVIFDKTTVGSVITDSTYVDENGNTIMTGVGNGSLTQGSTEAVNGGQLWQTNQRVTINENQITSIINGELGLTQTDGKTTTIDKNGTSTVINVAGANGDRIISGVADGV
ncbi:hypothetical protein, partial [Snodgrassella sp. CFCC 13594]|uniref:hypothetical protein n=1 Tax=Snodgrassella sp. CFCC 13594 TaxID=1775559 RepID=UPI00350F7C82